MKNSIKKILTIVVLIIGPVFIALSQPVQPSPGYNGGTWSPAGQGGPTLSCPTGSGIDVLLALALCYGVYLYWQMKKAEKVA